MELHGRQHARARGWLERRGFFSIFSRDEQTDPADIHSGGRALQAAVRPYPRAAAGEPLRLAFDSRHRVFEFECRHDPQVVVATEIFVPTVQYPVGYRVEVSDWTAERDLARQMVIHRHDPGRREHKVRITA